MDIQSAQKEVKAILEPIQHPRLGAFVGLQEEVGELSKAIMQSEIYGEKDIENLRLECADVFISLIDITNTFHIDLDGAVVEKIEDMRVKLPDWKKQYGERLKYLREKYDSEILG